MIARVVLFILLLPLVSTTFASTGRCEGPDPSLGIIQITGGTADSTFYVDDRNYVQGDGIWLYAETNGVWSGHAVGAYFGDPNHVDLQRGPVSLFGSIVPDDMPTCIDDPYFSSDLNIL